MPQSLTELLGKLFRRDLIVRSAVRVRRYPVDFSKVAPELLLRIADDPHRTVNKQ